MSTDARSARVDLPTVIAISALAYTLANIVHEGLGHGGVLSRSRLKRSVAPLPT